MQVFTEKRGFSERDALSTLEAVDVSTGERSVLKEFDHLIEAQTGFRTGTGSSITREAAFGFSGSPPEKAKSWTQALPPAATTTTCCPPTGAPWA